MTVCVPAAKHIFTSKQQARRALVQHRGGNTMRVYQCDFDRTHYHVTKVWKQRDTQERT